MNPVRYSYPASPPPDVACLPRVLYRLSLAATALLAGLALVCPLAMSAEVGGIGGQLIRCFAVDDLVRRSSVVAAAGIYLTTPRCFCSGHSPDSTSGEA